MQIIASQMADTVWPPAYGSITCFAVSAGVSVIDLTTMSGHPGNSVNGPDQGPMSGTDPNPIGHYITLLADGGDVYIAFCDTSAHALAVTVAGVSTVTGGNQLVTPFTATGTWKIPSGDRQSFLIPTKNDGTTPAGNKSLCRYLAFLTAAGTATLRMYQSSQ